MKKLFALEEDKGNLESGNNLLIDKVLEFSKKDASPISLTANVIKKRQELKEEIKDKLKTVDNDDEESGDDDKDNDRSGDSSNSGTNDNPSGDDNGSGNNDSSSDNNTDNKKSDSGKSNSNADSNSDAADDKESLNNLIGSGLSNDNGSNSNGSDDKKEEKPAEESFKSKLNISNIFAPIHNSYNRYLVALEDFNVPDKTPNGSQPIVYVKESVVEALNNLVGIANTYIAKNKTFIDSNSQSIKNINERLTVLKQFVDNRKYHFNNKLINDQTLLSNLAITDKSDIRETIKYLAKYIESSNKFVGFVLGNEFENMSSGLTNSEFISEQGDFAYKQMLPGFNLIRVHLDNYENYLKANIENFHYYKVRTFKTEDLYNLDAIALNEDKELDFIMTNLDKLLIDLSMSVDNFNVVNTNLNKLIDEVKVIIYDVENDKYTNLATIDIDSRVKDFIRFKIISETYYINVNLLIDFILNCVSVINSCVELKD